MHTQSVCFFCAFMLIMLWVIERLSFTAHFNWSSSSIVNDWNLLQNKAILSARLGCLCCAQLKRCLCCVSISSAQHNLDQDRICTFVHSSNVPTLCLSFHGNGVVARVFQSHFGRINELIKQKITSIVLWRARFSGNWSWLLFFSVFLYVLCALTVNKKRECECEFKAKIIQIDSYTYMPLDLSRTTLLLLAYLMKDITWDWNYGMKNAGYSFCARWCLRCFHFNCNGFFPSHPNAIETKWVN